ncbi:MAG TPA: Nramp family divalent metal transporter [Candidatus Limnocylindria bacterium]|nr:Nramp family divalent metal transporter [Candidatus Limnocylindria bacterium]
MRLRRRRTAIAAFLAVMGPGIITGFAGNDAGGVATYTAVGGRYGYELLWLLAIVSVSLLVVLDVCVRLAVVTGKGLSDLIRERFGVRWTVVAMLALIVANGSNVVAEYAGVAAALDLIGVPPLVSLPVTAAVLWSLIVFASYRLVERALFVLILAFVAYPVSAIIVGPDWGAALRSIVAPTVPTQRDAIVMALALVGTTITPYMLFYEQASVVDKGIDERSYGLARLDVAFGSILHGIFALFIVVVAATVLFPAGVRVETAEEAARALRPLAGEQAGLLFGMGLLGASLLGAVVMPLSTAYAICEAFGWESGISHDFDDAPVFMGLVTALLGLGAVVVLLVPRELLIQLIVVSQAVNGVLLPIVLVFLFKLATDRTLMRERALGRLGALVGWGTTALVAVMTAAYFVVR